jgi:phosphohistidine phosphatase SixA
MLYLLASVALAARIAMPAEDSAQQRREDLMAKLRSGGYTVLLRHARTDYSFKEDPGSVPKDRAMQRNLSDDGIRDAALMGVVFRKYGISFAEIISSPMFRTVETAEMAAGKPTTTMALRAFPSTPEQAALVKAAPKPGTNRLLVTHHFVIETHVPGVKPGDVGESEAAVVKHTADGKLELVGIIKLDDWKALANPGYGVTQAAPATTGLSHGGGPLAHAIANSNGVAPAIPDTHAGHLARDYVAAFNSGDPNKMRTFVESSLVADPARPTDDRIKSYAKLFEDNGALSLVSVDSSTATKVTLSVASKRGIVLLTVQSSDAEPMRATSVTFAFTERRD